MRLRSWCRGSDAGPSASPDAGVHYVIVHTSTTSAGIITTLSHNVKANIFQPFILIFPPYTQVLVEMSPPTDRESILVKLRKQVADGKIIVGAGAGIGLSAKFIEAGGGDLIIIYNSGRYRMAGRGSLAGLMPYGNANDVVLEMVRIPRASKSYNLKSSSRILWADEG
jgi:hypothetical protein